MLTHCTLIGYWETCSCLHKNTGSGVRNMCFILFVIHIYPIITFFSQRNIISWSIWIFLQKACPQPAVFRSSGWFLSSALGMHDEWVPVDSCEQFLWQDADTSRSLFFIRASSEPQRPDNQPSALCLCPPVSFSHCTHHTFTKTNWWLQFLI